MTRLIIIYIDSKKLKQLSATREFMKLNALVTFKTFNLFNYVFLWVIHFTPSINVFIIADKAQF